MHRSSRVPSLVGGLIAAELLLGAGVLRVLHRAGALDRYSVAARADTAPRSVAAEDVKIAGRAVTVWRPTKGSGPAPLVIFSHGFHGSSKQSTFLMRALADHGYLVVAVNHKDAGFGGGRGGAQGWLRPTVPFEEPDRWTDATYRDRADDVVAVIEAMKSDSSWSGTADWTRLALAGHSLGGYTVLGLAGAWPSWKISGVKAVLALSPFCTPYLSKERLGSVTTPVMFQGGTWDYGVTPSVRRSGGAFDVITAPAELVDIDRAGHFAWTDLNADHQANIVYYSVAFLDKYVKGRTGDDPALKRKGVAEVRTK
ncbi:MAG TPA: alpha/beta hydrolase [Chthonomonadaceae bacterium]|nr:alpha/beta hydrolase [Chthonomonadaceae bacterium]